MITISDQPPSSSVILLSELLARLYPEPGPDILTLADFKRRYRLTGLGPLAISAIEQAQRINREAGRFDEMGLCEFHIGLIYLDGDDYQGAIQQFREARLQWTFVDKTAAVCLAYLAEGLAQHQRYAHETALSLYGKAESCQKRIKFEPASENRDGFVAQFDELLRRAQETARSALWLESPALPAGELPAEETETAVTASPETTEEKEAAPPQPPISSEQSNSPIPAHIKSNYQLTWYKVKAKRPDPLFDEIEKSGWLLVREPEMKREIKKNALIVIANTDPDTKGSITLEPLDKSKQVFPRIYLARKELEGPFSRTAENQMILSSEIRHVPVSIEHILGYVVGLWLETGESEILED